jgi:hypothetical protein
MGVGLSDWFIGLMWKKWGMVVTLKLWLDKWIGE